MQDFVMAFRGDRAVSIHQIKDFFRTLDCDENGDLKIAELSKGILHIYTEHNVLVRSLASNTTVVWQLHTILLMFTVFTYMCIVFKDYIAALEKSFTSLLGLIYSLKCIFEPTMISSFACMIYVLITHPYDVGDRINMQGLNYRVKEMNLWVTTLVSSQGTLTYARNDQLASQLVFNHRRSPPLEEVVTVRVHSRSTREQIELLLERLRTYCSQNDREYDPGTLRIHALVIENIDSLRVDFKVTLRSNGQDGKLRDDRMVQFHMFLKESLDELGIRLSPYYWE